jgi:dienelactone hydrolase
MECATERLRIQLVNRSQIRGPLQSPCLDAKGMFLILHGAEDPNYPVEFGHVIDELKAAKTPFEVELYSGTAHGFSQPKDKAEERAISQAKATTGRTLKELFGV